MSSDPNERPTLPEASFAAHIDQACDTFESEWRAGRRPRIEDFLKSVSEDQQWSILRELLAVEIEYRRSQDEYPDLEDYCKTLPFLCRTDYRYFQTTRNRRFADETVG